MTEKNHPTLMPMNTFLKFFLICGFLILAAVGMAVATGYRLSDTLGNVFPKTNFTGDVDFGGNTARNVIIKEASINASDIDSGIVADERLSSSVVKKNTSYTENIFNDKLLIYSELGNSSTDLKASSTSGVIAVGGKFSLNSLRLVNKGSSYINSSFNSLTYLSGTNTFIKANISNYFLNTSRGIDGTGTTHCLTFIPTSWSQTIPYHVGGPNKDSQEIMDIQISANGTISVTSDLGGLSISYTGFRNFSDNKSILGKEYDTCVVMTPTNVTLYVNGKSRGFDSGGGYGSVPYAHTIYIGSESWHSRYFKGGVKDLMVFGTALTADQVMSIYEDNYKPPQLSVPASLFSSYNHKVGIGTGRFFCWDGVYTCLCNTTYNGSHRIDDC